MFAQTQIGSDINGENAVDESGYSVSISSDGTIVAIGAINNDENGQNSGHVRVYQESGGVWTQIGQDIDGEVQCDQSGFCVSLSNLGHRVAISSVNNDENGINAGHVRVYENINGIWSQVGQDIDGDAAFDRFGWSISLSGPGDILAIGAPFNDGNGPEAGHVKVYEDINGVWTQVGQDIEGEAPGDSFGRAVYLSEQGDRVAIGGPTNDGSALNAGHVRIYENINGVWTQIGQDIDGDAQFDLFGFSVSLSSLGDRVAIGTPFNDAIGNLAGQVKVYEYINGVWSQIGQDINGEAAEDQSGWSISMSNAGNRVAIGAPYNDGNLTSTGHARVYEDLNGVWTQVDNDIDGEAINDELGFSVSLSDNGNRLAIGAPLNDGSNEFNSGITRIFAMNSSLPVELLTFTARPINDNIHLEWETASELNNEGFYVQKSADGNDWKNLTFISGHHTTISKKSYDFIDRDVLSGPNYYRLKQVDFDGKFDFSNVVIVDMSDRNSSIMLFPNPVSEELFISTTYDVDVDIYNTLGQKINCLQISGEKSFDMSNLRAGVYVLQFSNGIVKQVIKE